MLTQTHTYVYLTHCCMHSWQAADATAFTAKNKQTNKENKWMNG